MGVVTIGIDLGQKRDPTAIAVAELDRRPREGDTTKTDDHYVIRHLERLPLGTPYPDVVRRMAAIVAGVRQMTGKPERTVPLGPFRESTDPGQAFGEMYHQWEARMRRLAAHQAAARGGNVILLPAELGRAPDVFADATGVGGPVMDLFREAGIRAVPCFFTHGDRRTTEGGHITIGKAWLVSRLQALLQSTRLHLPDTEEARVLAKELLDYEIRVDESANDRYGSFRVGTHDDLVTAVGLAVQITPMRWQLL